MITKIIQKVFIKDYQNTADPLVRARYGSVAGAVGIFTNLLLAGGKILIGTLFGAIAIVADGINNLTDGLSSVLTLVGFRLAAKQADEDHPYGHGRMEYITTLLIAVVMAVAGFLLIRESFPKIFAPEEAQITLPMLAALILSVLLKLWQYFFYRKMGKAIDSETLFAGAKDSRNDVVATLAILISVLLTPVIGYNADGLMGVAVAILILYSGLTLMWETIQILVGEGADEDLAEEIKAAVMGYEGIVGVHDLEVHNYGAGRLFASLHAEVPAHRDVLESHDLIDNIEREFRTGRGIFLTIHMDPIVTNDPQLHILREEITEILAAIDEELDFHDLRLVKGPTHTNILFDIVLPFGFFMTDEQVRAKVAECLCSARPDHFAVITIDKKMIKKAKKD